MPTNQSPTAPTLGLTLPNCWSLDEHYYTEVFAACTSIQTDNSPLWSGLHTPTAQTAALRENWGHCLNYQEDTHSLKLCRHTFIIARGWFNPNLEQLGDDGDAYRHCQAHTIPYRREDEPSRSNNQNNQKSIRCRCGHSRGQHQSQHQQHNHNDGYNTNGTR